MPKTLMDWMGVTLLWLGAAVLAVQTGGLPLVAGAPSFLASPLWGYVPITMLTIALAVFIFRHVRPLKTDTLTEIVSLPPSSERSENRLKAKGTPNLSVENAFLEISRSAWADGHSATPEEVVQEVVDKLYLGSLTAFARPAPNEMLEAISPDAWAALTFDLTEGNIVTKSGDIVYYMPQFDRTYVARIWPSRSSWMSR